MATQGVVVTPYVFSDYSQWERKRTCILKKNHSCVTVKRNQINNTVISKPLAETDNNIRLLEIQIAHKKHLLADKVQRLQSLSCRDQHNTQLITYIQQCDDQTTGTITGALERYHRFKDCLSLINDKSSKNLKDAQKELRQFTEQTKREIQELHNEIEKCAKVNKRENKQLQTLMNYKDKEYPLKLVQTEQLRAQQEYLNEKHHRDEIELEYTLDEERNKYSQTMEDTRISLETQATENYMSIISCGTIAKAVHNKIMEKEVLVHEKRLHHINREITILKDKIKHIKGLITQNPTHQLRISAMGICCPDMEIPIDIS